MNRKQIARFLELLGGEPHKQYREGWVVAKCPLAPWRHSGGVDHNPSFGIRIEQGDSFTHCLSGGTRVVTWGGVLPIRELAGGVHRVLTTGGLWVDAPFKSYGCQPLLKITMRLNGVERVEYATPKHRWFIRGGYERTTDRLRTGDRLEAVLPSRVVPEPTEDGIRHGIVFGDGSITYGKYATVNLHGEKKELACWFKDYKPVDKGSFFRIYIGKDGSSWKKLPSIDSDPGYLAGFIAGWLATDGFVHESGVLSIGSAVREHIDWLRLACLRLGLALHPTTVQVRNGYLSEPSPFYSATVVRSILARYLLIRDKHRDRFKCAAYDRLRWTVVSVEDPGVVEEVFCAEVPGTRAFALEHNLLTGNCWSCGYHGSQADLLLEMKHLHKAQPSDESYDFAAALQLIAQAEDDIELDLDGPDIEEELFSGKQADHVFPEWWLDSFVKATYSANAAMYLKSRQVPIAVSDALDLRCDTSEQRVCFPVRDFQGRLRGLHGRAVAPDVQPRYRMYLCHERNNPEVWLGESWLDLGKPVVVVESVFDLARVYQVYRNVVCPLMASMNKEKLQRVRGVLEWVTLFDGDKAGDMARGKFDAVMTDHIVTHLRPPKGFKDPGEMAVEDVAQLLSQHVSLDEILIDVA